MPIDVMRELGLVGTIIGVNVMLLDDLVKEYRFGDSISGPHTVLSMLNPFDDTSAPNIYETLMRVIALHEAHREEAKQRLANIYITPPVERYSIIDFGSYEAIIEVGYRSAQTALAAWKEKNGKRAESSTTRQLDSTLTDLERVLD